MQMFLVYKVQHDCLPWEVHYGGFQCANQGARLVSLLLCNNCCVLWALAQHSEVRFVAVCAVTQLDRWSVVLHCVRWQTEAQWDRIILECIWVLAGGGSFKVMIPLNHVSYPLKSASLW